jgi:cytochrome o ubiquinol oxidase subunit 1
MVAVGAIGAFATFVVFAWRDHDEDTIPADEVARIDRNNRTLRHAMLSKQAAE